MPRTPIPPASVSIRVTFSTDSVRPTLVMSSFTAFACAISARASSGSRGALPPRMFASACCNHPSLSPPISSMPSTSASTGAHHLASSPPFTISSSSRRNTPPPNSEAVLPSRLSAPPPTPTSSSLSPRSRPARSRRCLVSNPSRIRVVPHGTDLPPSGATVPRSKLILTVGALQKRKNTLRLVEAFESASTEWKFVLAGSPGGYGAAEILDRIARSPARDRIEVTGYVSAEQLKSLYQRAAISRFRRLTRDLACRSWKPWHSAFQC